MQRPWLVDCPKAPREGLSGLRCERQREETEPGCLRMHQQAPTLRVCRYQISGKQNMHAVCGRPQRWTRRIAMASGCGVCGGGVRMLAVRVPAGTDGRGSENPRI